MPKFKKNPSPFRMKSSLDKLLKETDMEKLRSKQRRSSKGTSEHQYFSDPKSQGDEPRVGHTWKKKK